MESGGCVVGERGGVAREPGDAFRSWYAVKFARNTGGAVGSTGSWGGSRLLAWRHTSRCRGKTEDVFGAVGRIGSSEVLQLSRGRGVRGVRVLFLFKFFVVVNNRRSPFGDCGCRQYRTTAQSVSRKGSVKVAAKKECVEGDEGLFTDDKETRILWLQGGSFCRCLGAVEARGKRRSLRQRQMMRS